MLFTAYPGLLAFIAEKADVPVEKLHPDQSLDELALDSLALIEIALFVQREFGIEVPEGDLDLGQKLSEWAAYLDERVGR
ncbi:acyl carrier protein [Streptomyces sp. WELS2]|uniref:acyl carrier protein n=1 Tax=Streptomyces sp. WELS2 TaxID=2749435 RepID=UPI0015F0B34A|nr:acyl carrier protein [Streptomyces sp. WELS2]